MESIVLPKPYLSVTQIEMFLRCPRQYYYRYIEGLKIPPTAAQSLGSATHKTIEFNLVQKKETYRDLKLNDVQEYFASEWEARVPNTEFAPDEDPGKLKDEGVGLVTLHHQTVAPKIQPVAVEEEFIVEFENVGYVFKGYIDTVDENGWVIDTKTANRTPPKDVANRSLQLTAYALGYRQKYGTDEVGLRLDYLVRNKKPTYVPLETERTQADVNRFLKIVGYVVEAIEANLFYPNPTHILCKPDWCGFWNICMKEI